MKANELEMVRTARASDCLVMDTGEETKKIPFGEAALILRPGVDILDNSNFLDPANQRGMAGYTSPAGVMQYTIDRWISAGDSMAAGWGLYIEDGGIRLAKGSAFQQRMEPKLLEGLNGKAVTFSAMIDEEVYASTFTWDASAGYTVFKQTNGFWLSYNGTGRYAQIYNANGTGTELVQAAKLELGFHQTLAHQDAAGNWVLNDPPPDKTLELLKCQKYQYKNTNGSTEFIRASAIVADAIYFDIPVPVPMRATPVISNPENIELIDLTSRTILTGFSIGVSNHEGATIRINAVKQNHGVTDAYLKATAVLFDANL